jgi:hypothetical protein
MKNRMLSIGLAVVLTVQLSMTAGIVLAGEGTPMTPELAAKREMVRKQEVQRITPAKRKAAADALKAERLKVHQARQAGSEPALLQSK